MPVLGQPAAQGSPHPQFGKQTVPSRHWQSKVLPQLFLRRPQTEPVQILIALRLQFFRFFFRAREGKGVGRIAATPSIAVTTRRREPVPAFDATSRESSSNRVESTVSILTRTT
jgi:hypothetical protein